MFGLQVCPFSVLYLECQKFYVTAAYHLEVPIVSVIGCTVAVYNYWFHFQCDWQVRKQVKMEFETLLKEGTDRVSSEVCMVKHVHSIYYIAKKTEEKEQKETTKPPT